jgi:hypothetical protein
MVPMIVIGPFVGKWSDASYFGRVLLALLAVWFVVILIGGGFLLFRALVRASRGHSE